MDQEFAKLKQMVEDYKSTPQAAGAVNVVPIIDIIVTIVNMFLAPVNPALAAIVVQVANILKGLFTA